MSKLAKREGIKVEGHRGTWYVVDEKEYDGETLYMLESELYGDDAAWILIDSDGNLVLEDIYNGWLDYEEALECGYIE